MAFYVPFDEPSDFLSHAAFPGEAADNGLIPSFFDFNGASVADLDFGIPFNWEEIATEKGHDFSANQPGTEPSSGPTPREKRVISKATVAYSPAEVSGSKRPRSAKKGGASDAPRSAPSSKSVESEEEDAHEAAEMSGKTLDKDAKRREWNRANARKSRERKKFLADSCAGRINALMAENAALHHLVKTRGLAAEWAEVEKTGGHSSAASTLSSAASSPLLSSANPSPAPPSSVPKGAPIPSSSLPLRGQGIEVIPGQAVKLIPTRSPSSSPPLAALRPMPINKADFSLIETVTRCNKHFVISDPLAPDNPLVFASAGFHELTGYTPDEILGYNCRFLQGRDTDMRVVARMRRYLDAGEDVLSFIRNYKKDGTPFWNSVFMAGLKDASGRVVHVVGIQQSVPDDAAAPYIAAQEAALVAEGYGDTYTPVGQARGFGPLPTQDGGSV